ncbi:MAG: DUF748 domain-containing protein, partial [Gammaproteobacteria bacterium]|nr:DUF748 domain-containing protein [Gammaproteobacteria bacterium]
MNTSSQSDSSQIKPSGNKTRRGLIWLGSIALLLILVLVALPIVTARVASSWLQDNGASNASIEDIDINLFTGTVRLSELDASGGAQQRLHIGLAEVDVRWWPLASKRIHVDAVRLSDTQIDVAPDGQGNWQVGGLFISPAASEPTPESGSAVFDWGIGSELIALSNVSLTYQDSLFDTAVEIHEIAIGSHFSWQAGEETELVIDMDVNDSPINVRSTLVPWGERQSISGNLQLSDHDLSDHGAVLQQLAGLQGAQGIVSMDLEVTASLNEAGVVDVLVTGPLEINGLGFTLDSLSLNNQQIDWQGQIDVKLPVLDNQPLVAVDGSVQLAGTQLVAGDLELEASLDAFDYNGRFELFIPEDAAQPPRFTLAASLDGQGLAADHSRLAFELARLGSFSINELQLNDLQQASVAQLQLRGLRLMADTPAQDNAALNQLLRFDTLDLDQITFDAQSGVLIDSVTLGEPVLSIVRQAGGEIARVSELLAVFAEEPEQEASQQGSQSETGTTAPLTFVINSLQVMSTNFLALEDVSVTPPVNFQLSAMELLVNNINGGSSDPMDLTLATGNDNMALNVSGDIAAFADPMSVNLMANVSALELPRFSSYIPGYNIDRGRLSVDSTVAISGETLDIQNTVLLEAIQLAGKAADDGSILVQGMAMPLDVALDLLRDSDDRIELDLPVTGSLSDPKFDSTDIIRTVMQNALQNAAMSYVTNALQPLGALLFVGGLASEASVPRFEPVNMRSGEASLSAENREYLLKIADLLKQRPSLQLTLCGIVTEADREVLAAMALR